MKQFKITVGDKSQITTTGVELYTTILKKFGVEYTIEEINQPNQKSYLTTITHTQMSVGWNPKVVRRKIFRGKFFNNSYG